MDVLAFRGHSISCEKNSGPDRWLSPELNTESAGFSKNPLTVAILVLELVYGSPAREPLDYQMILLTQGLKEGQAA